ncbi:hypothetical protein BDV06DRAFT_228176 [Aspergillus oleicola]
MTFYKVYVATTMDDPLQNHARWSLICQKEHRPMVVEFTTELKYSVNGPAYDWHDEPVLFDDANTSKRLVATVPGKDILKWENECVLRSQPGPSQYWVVRVLYKMFEHKWVHFGTVERYKAQTGYSDFEKTLKKGAFVEEDKAHWEGCENRRKGTWGKPVVPKGSLAGKLYDDFD